MSRDVPTFRVASNSRHPILGRDYDAKTHRYTTAYLNPGKYTIFVDAFPGTELFDTVEPGRSGPTHLSASSLPGTGPGNGNGSDRGGPLHPIKIERLRTSSRAFFRPFLGDL